MPCPQRGQSITGQQAKKAGEYHCQTRSTVNIKGETAAELPSHTSPLCCQFGQTWYFLEMCLAGGAPEENEPVEDDKNAHWC